MIPAIKIDADRRTILGALISAGTASLAGCGFFRSDDALDVVVENEASSDQEVQIFIPARTDAFDRTASVAAGDQTTFEDAIEYPEHPRAVEYQVTLVDQSVREQGTFALSDELQQFGFRVVEPDGSLDVVTLRDYRD